MAVPMQEDILCVRNTGCRISNHWCEDESLVGDGVLYFPTCTHFTFRLQCKISHFRVLNNVARILVIISTEGSVWFSEGEGH